MGHGVPRATAARRDRYREHAGGAVRSVGRSQQGPHHADLVLHRHRCNASVRGEILRRCRRARLAGLRHARTGLSKARRFHLAASLLSFQPGRSGTHAYPWLLAWPNLGAPMLKKILIALAAL